MDTKLSLQSVLDAFKGPVNEEQTWAICFQVIKHIQDGKGKRVERNGQDQDPSLSGEQDPCLSGEQNPCLSGQNPCLSGEQSVIHEYPLVENPSQILLHSDGSISLESITSHVSEKEFISSLGIVLYEALDYGCDESEERSLEPSLEQFIEKLTLGSSNVPSCDVSDNGGDDEGIERDSGDDLTLASVLSMCNNHLQPKGDLNPEPKSTATSQTSTSQNQFLNNQSTNLRKQCYASAEKHYKAVVRAVVSEGRDLISFLDQIKRGSTQLRSVSSDPLLDAALDELCVGDWARLWMQLVKDLRSGVRLKKVDRNEPCTVEYEMTPYEMLLDDIRSKRYHLRHVKEEKIPQEVRKDAHSLILEFIRSRPPLRPASDRLLPPTPNKKESTHDQLMRSIKKEHILRPTGSLRERPRRQCTSLGNIREFPPRESSLREFSLRDTSQEFSRLNVNDDSSQGMVDDGTPNKLSRRKSDYGCVQTPSSRSPSSRSPSSRSPSSRSPSSRSPSPRSPSPRSGRRKLIKADIDIDLVCYSDDEDIDSCVLTIKKNTIPTTTTASSGIPDKSGCGNRRSFRNLFGFGQSLKWNFKSNS